MKLFHFDRVSSPDTYAKLTKEHYKYIIMYVFTLICLCYFIIIFSLLYIVFIITSRQFRFADAFRRIYPERKQGLIPVGIKNTQKTGLVVLKQS